MTGRAKKLSESERKQWARKLERAQAAHDRTRRQLDETIADARAAGFPLLAVAEHTSYSREWARRIADRIEAERANEAPPPS